MSSPFANLEKVSEQLYREAVEKADAEIAKRRSAADAEREKILAQAKLEAKDLLQKAEQQARQNTERAERELKQKGLELMEEMRRQAQHLLSQKLIDIPLKKAMSESDFLKDLLLTTARSFQKKGFALVLSQADQEKLAALVRKNIEDLDLEFEALPQGSFKLQNTAEGLLYSFSEDEFRSLLRHYLSQSTAEILFGSADD